MFLLLILVSEVSKCTVQNHGRLGESSPRSPYKTDPGDLTPIHLDISSATRRLTRLRDESAAHNREMGKQVLLQVLQGNADANIRFDSLRSLLLSLGFSERVKGSHHIFLKQDVAEILNLQPAGSLAKPYQVKQVRRIITRYKLATGLND